MKNVNPWIAGSLLFNLAIAPSIALSAPTTTTAPKACAGVQPGPGTVVFSKINSILESAKDETVTISGTGVLNGKAALGSEWTISFKAPFTNADLNGTDDDSKRKFLARNCTDYGRQSYATSRQLTVGGEIGSVSVRQDGTCPLPVAVDVCGISTYVKPVVVAPDPVEVDTGVVGD